MVVVSLVSFASCVWLTETRQPWAFFLSPTRAWEFAIGGLGILIPRGRATLRGCDQGRLARLLGWVGLAGIAVAAALYDKSTAFPGAAALLPTLTTVLVLRAEAADRSTVLGQVLGWRGLQELGRLSYSWYLWHWPLLVLASTVAEDISLATRLGIVLVALGVSEASYRFVENPVRYSLLLKGRPARSFALGAALTLAGVGLGLGWRLAADTAAMWPEQARIAKAASDMGALYKTDCISDLLDTDVKDCSLGTPAGRLQVVLLGDSHMAHWVPALERIAEGRGWRIVPVIKSACPPAEVSFSYYRLGRKYHECGVWRQKVLDRIAQLEPHLVITTSVISYKVTDQEWNEGTQSTFGVLSRAADTVVHIRDVPRPGFDVPACLSRASWRAWLPTEACTFPRETNTSHIRFRLEEQAAAMFDNVHTVDVNYAICPETTCAPEAEGTIIYRDSNHLTAAYAATLAPVLAEHLDSVLGVDHTIREAPSGACVTAGRADGARG